MTIRHTKKQRVRVYRLGWIYPANQYIVVQFRQEATNYFPALKP